MSSLRSFRDLKVWQKSMDLAEATYKATRAFPGEERFGLVSQMRRAAVSIPSNIAEGQSRNSTGEFTQFLGLAKGSLAELETQVELAKRLQFLNTESHSNLLRAITEIGKMLNGLLTSLRQH
jgi:four helix bundle protein